MALIRITNARVWTGDEARPWAEAVAIEDDSIAAVGGLHDVRSLPGPSREIDARGGLVVPGFIDAHLHLLAGGFRLSSVQLRDVASRADLTARLAAFATTTRPGTWITGGDWDRGRWGGELPTREWIDGVTPENPVWVHGIDGHMALANSLALTLADVTRATSDPAGGLIIRDESGEPTGVLKDNAMALIASVMPPPTHELEDRALDAAMSHLAAHGVTSVHHMGAIPPDNDWRDLAAFRRAWQSGRLRTRIYSSVPLRTWPRLAAAIEACEFGGADGRGDDWLRVGAVKGFVDGSLGSRTAAFVDPYLDAAGESGLLVTSERDLRESIAGADAAGLQPVIHAIGDRANALLLDIFTDTAARNGPRDRRLRIEHAQHLRASDIKRFAEQRIIASMQPFHLAADGCWAEQAIGTERAKTSYAFRSLLNAGAHLAFGSDWFVGPPIPIDGIAAAVTRRTTDDCHPNGWVPEERIALDEALRAYTHHAAYASFEEHLKGRLTPGMKADLVVLDRDLFAVPSETIRDTRVMMTIVGGRVVYESTGTPRPSS